MIFKVSLTNRDRNTFVRNVVLNVVLIGSMLMLLSSCIGNDKNAKATGLVVHFAESHTGKEMFETAGILTGGYDKDHLDHHTLRDKNGRIVSLYRAYIVLDNIALTPCFNFAQIPQSFINSLFPYAEAHAGHGSEPVGGRALDAPNVIDIITQDAFILPLGDLAIAPDNYCGAQVSLVRLASIAYGKPEYVVASNDNPITLPEVPELSGLSFSLRADYCAEFDTDNVCTQRNKVDLDDAGLNLPANIVIDFVQPLLISKKFREVYVVIGINYDKWLENIDISQLQSDSSEQEKLVDNIYHSLYLYEKGFGDLPVNIGGD